MIQIGAMAKVFASETASLCANHAIQVLGGKGTVTVRTGKGNDSAWFAISDTADYGIVRLVVDDPEVGKAALHDAGFTVKEGDVICVELPDQPGGLAAVLKIVANAGVNIEYVYSLIATYIVINVADVDKALQLLRDKPVRLVSQEEIAQT